MIGSLRLRLFSLACVWSSPGFAQDDFQQWVGASAKLDLSDKVSLLNETQLRFSDKLYGLFQIQASLLLAYEVAPKINVAAGYLHSPSYRNGDLANMERRAREQVSFDNLGKLFSANVSARLRFEQRWRDDLDGTAWRVRPSLRLAIPLGGKAAPTLNLSEEVFINLNTTPMQTQDGIERLRTSAIVSTPLSKAVRLETGYINQHRFVADARNFNEHILSGALSFSF